MLSNILSNTNYKDLCNTLVFWFVFTPIMSIFCVYSKLLLPQIYLSVTDKHMRIIFMTASLHWIFESIRIFICSSLLILRFHLLVCGSGIMMWKQYSDTKPALCWDVKSADWGGCCSQGGHFCWLQITILNLMYLFSLETETKHFVLLCGAGFTWLQFAGGGNPTGFLITLNVYVLCLQTYLCQCSFLLFVQHVNKNISTRFRKSRVWHFNTCIHVTCPRLTAEAGCATLLNKKLWNIIFPEDLICIYKIIIIDYYKIYIQKNKYRDFVCNYQK